MTRLRNACAHALLASLALPLVNGVSATSTAERKGGSKRGSGLRLLRAGVLGTLVAGQGAEAAKFPHTANSQVSMPLVLGAKPRAPLLPLLTQQQQSGVALSQYQYEHPDSHSALMR